MEEQPAQPVEKKPIVSPSSHESFFGTILFGMMLVLLLGTVAVIGWGVYRGLHFTKEQAALPSIVVLPEQNNVVEETPKEEAAPAVVSGEGATKVTEELTKKAKATDIKVLNGGAAKGSAGVATGILTKDGFTKVTIGNTLKDYTGVVVYYAVGLDQEAGVVKDTLAKTYPQAVTKPALVDNKETTQAPLTVIVGK